VTGTHYTWKLALTSDKIIKQRLSILCVFQREAWHLNTSQQYGCRQHITNTQNHAVSMCYRSACYGVPLPVQTTICGLNFWQSNTNATTRADYTGQQNLTFFFVPQTSIGELSSTFYAECRYVYRIFLSGRVSEILRNSNVQNSTLRAHGTGWNLPL